MMNDKCIYCANGYHKRNQTPCKQCRNNPYDSYRQSAKRYDYYEHGEKEEMQVVESQVWM